MLFEKDHTFWYETLRSFGHITYGGADFGEVLATAKRIVEGDYQSWYDEWLALAERVESQATHGVSARDAYLRAANYYRTAEFFIHDTAVYQRGVECFRKALPELAQVEIPYEGTTLPGYYYDAGAERTVVMHNGFDGSAEEMHFFGAAAMHERGFNVLTFDGPGQPGPRHLQGLAFRPDWENVVGPVLDWLGHERVALLGNSMGGVLAPRAAAFEPRIKAVVALDGVYDMGAKVTEAFGGDLDLARTMLASPEVDAVFEQLMAGDPAMRWACTHGMWAMGVPTPREYASALLDYNVRDGVAERITCPTLVCAAEGDLFFAGQPEQLYDHLTCPKTYLSFTAEEGGDAHCQSGAQRLAMARIGDWLEETL
ncbi:alpha/beta hydrolase family protein [Nonomuraea sp. NPDC050556]|uniref:alpha/beta hydrolase family protein n=1 Tax=Nonomuraea sp. NPDC050556 TaxID=3364369 RepID=UPI0037A9349C